MKNQFFTKGLAVLATGTMLIATSAQAIIIGNPLIAREYATDFPPGSEPYNVLVLNATALPAGHLDAFLSYNQGSPGGSPTPSAGHLFAGLIFRHLTGNDYEVVYSTGTLAVPGSPVDSIISYAASFEVQAGDLFGHFGGGIPVDIIATGTDSLFFPTVSMAPQVGDTVTLGSADWPSYPQNRTYSFAVSVPDAGSTLALLALVLPGLAYFRRKLA